MQFFCLSIFVILGRKWQKHGKKGPMRVLFFLSKLSLVQNVLLREVARSFELGLFVCF